MRTERRDYDTDRMVRAFRGRWWRLVLGVLAALWQPFHAVAKDDDTPGDQFMALNILVSGAHTCGASREDVIKVSNTIASEFARKYPPVASIMTPAWMSIMFVGWAYAK